MIGIEDKEIIKQMKQDYAAFRERYDEEIRRKSTNECLNDPKSLRRFLGTGPDFNFVQDILGFLRKYHLGKRVQLSGSCYYEHFVQMVSGKKPEYDEINLTIPFEGSSTPLGEKCIDNLASGNHPARWDVEVHNYIKVDKNSTDLGHYQEKVFDIYPITYKAGTAQTRELKLIAGAHPINLTFTTKERYWEED